MAGPYRTIVESELFSVQCAEIEPEVQRMDAILSAVRWELGRYPDNPIHRVVDAKNLWLVKTVDADKPGRLRFLRIWYSISDQVVTLLSIEITEEIAW